jgi:iron complex transport system ATP-binding protein
MTELKATGIRVTRGDRALLRGVDCALKSGELVVLLGPNGAGKTTLLRVLLGLAEARGGAVTLAGRPLADYTRIERARQLAYLPQQPQLAWPLQVHDVVALGRYAYGAASGRLSPADREAIADAMAACELDALAGRDATTLSGGEQARMHCARALATRAPLLLADEPVAALDPLHQHRVMKLLRRYADSGHGVLVVLHDVALAARYADRLLWLVDGEICADGSVEETLTVERMRAVYGVDARVSGREVTIDGEAPPPP